MQVEPTHLLEERQTKGPVQFHSPVLLGRRVPIAVLFWPQMFTPQETPGTW